MSDPSTRRLLPVDPDVTPGSGLSRDAHGRIRLQRGATGYAAEGDFLSPVYDTGTGPHIALRWIEQWTAPQRWKKHPANPVYGPHQSGEWDTWTNGVSIVPCNDGKMYRMFYSGHDNAGIGFAEASIEDPVTWLESPASPVLRPRRDNWEGGLINQPRVVIVSPDHWRVYYTGWGFQGPGTPWAMGLAESFDGGITWKRHGEDPILARGNLDSPDGGGACVPMVLRIGDRWMMWYTAGIVNPNEHTQIHICLAESDDGINWHKHAGNPVLGDDFSDDPQRSVTSRCYVQHDNGVFRMWFSYARPNYEIRYAESLDGIHWEQSPVTPVLGSSPAPAWDDEMVEYPEVQVQDGIFRLWFCGNGFGSVGYAEGIPETGIEVRLRSGATETPDDAWSNWIRVKRHEAAPVSRYVQVQARLWSKNPVLSPSLNDISIDRLPG